MSLHPRFRDYGHVLLYHVFTIQVSMLRRKLCPHWAHPAPCVYSLLLSLCLFQGFLPSWSVLEKYIVHSFTVRYFELAIPVLLVLCAQEILSSIFRVYSGTGTLGDFPITHFDSGPYWLVICVFAHNFSHILFCFCFWFFFNLFKLNFTVFFFNCCVCLLVIWITVLSWLSLSSM